MMSLNTRYRTFLLAAALTLTAVAGCEISSSSGPDSNYNPGPGGDGNGNGNNRKVILTLTPDAVTVKAGETAAFQAIVVGATDTTVTWTLTPGGGTITAGGFYTAPATITGSSMTVVIKARSNADTTVSDSAVVTVTPGDPVQTGPCFEEDILPIFTSNCAMSGCHDAASHQEGFVLTSYGGVMSGIDPGRPNNSEIYEKITESEEDERMPPAPMPRLTAEQIKTIRDWIADGAPNTPCQSGGGCDTTNVTLSGVIRPIFQNNCVGCHTGSNGGNGNVDLSTYNGIKAVVDDGRLYKSVAHLPGAVAMPNTGGKLPDCKIQQIGAWINRGAPNN